MMILSITGLPHNVSLTVYIIKQEATCGTAHDKPHQPIPAVMRTTSRECRSIFTAPLLPVSLRGTSSLIGWRLMIDIWTVARRNPDAPVMHWLSWAGIWLLTLCPWDVNTTPGATSAAPALSLAPSNATWKATAVWEWSAVRNKRKNDHFSIVEKNLEIVLLNLSSYSS